MIGRLLIDMLRAIHAARRCLSDKSKPHLNGDVEYILLSYAVLIGGQPAARQTDNSGHGGTDATGFPTVIIGP